MTRFNRSDDVLHHGTTADDRSRVDSGTSDAKLTFDTYSEEQSFTLLPNIDDNDRLNDDVIAIWLDNTIGTSIESQWFNIVRQLRQIISHVQVFTDVHKCIDYICASGIERIFMIVAGTYGDDFDAKLFEEILNDVFIYILTLEKLEYNTDHRNIRGFFANTNILINQLYDDYKIYTSDKVTDMNFIKTNTNGNATHCINPQLIQWKCLQLMVDINRQMPCPRKQSMDRLIRFCRNYYSDNPNELKILADFETTYEPNEVVRWHTRECFLYKLLNLSMRTNNVDAVMDFSHILIDIYERLEKFDCQQQFNQRTTVYRGQYMSINERYALKLHIGGFISNNTMLSTSLDRNVAEVYIGAESSINSTSVLIEIFVDCTSPDTYSKPFAAISDISLFSEEHEVLFTNGHIFRIDSCEAINDNSWLLQLTLCDNANPIVQNSFDYFDIAVLQLLEILPKISPNTNKANDRMLQWWRRYCADNPVEQAKVDQFEKSYRSDSAIRWYTKDSLLHRLLNTALRRDNIDMIIDFRYFIIDLYEELTKSHLDYVRSFKERNLTVYRGQKINLTELRRLKHSIGNYTSIKSLFSASLSSVVALCSAELDESDRKQFLQSVLFQIDIDMENLAQSGKNHIFANISHMSCFIDEDEVLFMANTQFRIQSVTNWNGRFWLICVTLLSQDDANGNDMRIMNQYLNYLTKLVAQNYGDDDSIRCFLKKMIVKKE